MELTEVEFWERYWADCKLPNIIDTRLSFERCLAKALQQELAGCAGEVLEIGCAPGRWLAFMAKEIGLLPSGIEYSQAGMEATRKNFELLNIPYGEILAGDFFTLEPEAKYDVVVSLGFIEHFDNPGEVVSRHLAWLKPGGRLVLGVPNFRGIYHLLQGALDKTVLEKHNLDIMHLGYFEQLAHQLGLEILFRGYLGSFEPCLPIFKEGPLGPAQTLIKLGLGLTRRVRQLNWFDELNSPFWSSYILAVYRKGLEI
ncbi:MAG TPA: class I SAM-dependent methyltransferase [Bacillota bacterium]|nr:class I SAM-dependent methyltransferase [Bacillota bacterium]